MKKFFKFILMSVGGLVLLGIIIAVVSGGDDSTTTGTKVSGDDTKQEAKKDEESVSDKTFKVGDTIDLNGLELTINSAKFVPASEYSPAEKGKVLKMEVNVTNNTDNSAFVDNTDFNLYDKDGNSLEAYYGGDDLDISGDINKGKKLQGTLTFDVPESDSYELIYEPTFSWTDESITWNIQPQE